MKKGSVIVCLLTLGMSTTVADLIFMEAGKMSVSQPVASGVLEVLAVLVFAGVPVFACVWWNSREKG